MVQPLRIAVADDESDVREYFCKILPHLGHQVVGAASNGRELVELCGQTRPDLVITDMRMPDMDGDEAMQRICANSPTPFILVSAYPYSETGANSADRRGWTSLNKPISRQQLEAAIEAVVGNSPSTE